MAKTTTKRAANSKVAKSTTRRVGRISDAAKATAFGLPLKTWVGGFRKLKSGEGRGGRRAFVFIFSGSETKGLRKIVASHLRKWQLQDCLESNAESQFFHGAEGPVWILRVAENQRPGHSAPESSLEKMNFARFRDLAGAIVPQLSAYRPEKLILECHGLTQDEEEAVLVGLEMASYSYQENRPKAPKARKKLPALLFKQSSLTNERIERAAELALAVNIARHYTNIPGGELNPRTYAESVRALFAESSTLTVDIWEGERLVEERMNLLLAVGGGATEGPRLVHLRYRPKERSSAKPVAIVGKGVTFDSGGLDIKPSSAMRWMKKDMGGSAAALAIAFWAERTGFPMPLDIYLSLAENAVSNKSFRPGDVLVARSGSTVEIGNTDAEGRLALADALDVAVTQKGDDEPQAVIDISTLTGAIKVGLGSEVAGLFSNSDHLAGLLFEAGHSRGDLMWRMPLYQPYRSQIRSTFADLNNSAESGFGGAITAALFLESFVRNRPWAHLDIYAWRDSGGGAWAESGGSGQAVLAVIEALTRLNEESSGIEMA